MPSILDKFGKASGGNDVAIATTVKTTRVALDTVLEAFDLSEYAQDTPVFVVTYKKVTDPLTGEVSITNLISWKALVNVGANTLTNLTLAPGYADTGNAIGDFIECIPTSYWEDSLIDGILTSLNPDGTLKPQAVKDALDLPATSPDWTPLATPPSTIVCNGNRSYAITIPGIDYTDRINPGTRIRTTRTVAAPTQSTSLNGTNQYWVKTSPNKMTFTDDFVVSAWIKLSSYPTTNGCIISRYNGTNGWRLGVRPSGQLEIYGYNGVGNYSGVYSNQSIPLNKWVHIAIQLDMSTYTLSPTTTYIMFDGVDVSSVLERGGTNPTALVQAGNLEIGSYNGGTGLFPGKIEQVAIFNAKVTQATMRSYISQGLIGNETSLASAYSFNGVATDLNATTPNDLTAMNSATATNADSPFGGQASGLISGTLDYGIVQVATFSTNTTLTVQVPEGCTIPTSGGVSSVSYSSVKSPYGMPINKNKWQVISLSMVRGTVTNPIASSFNNPGSRNITVPVGVWDALLSFSSYGARGGAGVLSITSMLSTSASAFVGDPTLKVLTYIQTPASSDNAIPIERSVPFVATSATVLYLTMQNNSGATLVAMGNLDDFAPGQIVLTNAYL